MSPQTHHLKQFGNPQHVSANVADMMAGTSSSASVYEQSFHEGGNRDWRGQNFLGVRLAAANARKKRQTTASLRPSWWKWQTR